MEGPRVSQSQPMERAGSEQASSEPLTGSAGRDDAADAANPVVWVDCHGDALFRYAYLRLRDRELAEEVVQECFVAAIGARKGFAARSSERTWLIGILKRKVIDCFRRRARERSVEAIETVESSTGEFFTSKGLWDATLARWGGDPARLAENREFWQVVESCLSGLSPRLADAFVLREMENMPSEEICRVLELTPTNLWARLHRARLGLRRCLEVNWFAQRKKRP